MQGNGLRSRLDATHDFFQSVNVGQKALAPRFGDAHDRLRASASGFARHRDNPEFCQRVKMTIEITVGEVARMLQLPK